MASCSQIFTSTCQSRAWNDRRDIDSIKSDDKIKLGTVTHIPSQEVFGKIFPSDDDQTIRKKMAMLFFGGFPIAPIRAIFRIGIILSGHWAWGQAIPETLKQWKTERRIAALKDPAKAPGRAALYTRIALQILYRLSEGIAKLITLPIATLLCTLSALISIGDPLLSRLLYARIEEIWSIDLGEWNNWSQIINYLAPCMLPVRVGEKINLYKAFLNYKEDTLRSRSFSLQKSFQDHRAYLGDDYQPFLETVQNLRNQIKKITDSDTDEIQKIQKRTIPREQLEDIQAKRKYLLDLRMLFQDFVEKADEAADKMIRGVKTADAAELQAQALFTKLKDGLGTLHTW